MRVGKITRVLLLTIEFKKFQSVDIILLDCGVVNIFHIKSFLAIHKMHELAPSPNGQDAY